MTRGIRGEAIELTSHERFSPNFVVRETEGGACLFGDASGAHDVVGVEHAEEMMATIAITAATATATWTTPPFVLLLLLLLLLRPVVR